MKEIAVLKKYTKDHIKQTVNWLNDTDLKASFGLTRKVTVQSHIKWVESLQNCWLKAIYYKPTNTYCGNVLYFINHQHDSAFLQIYIGEKGVRGKGVATQTLKKTLEIMFEEKNINRVWLKVLQNNINGIKLYEELGFTLEGIERESLLYNNKYLNQRVYSLLRKEWRESGEIL